MLIDRFDELAKIVPEVSSRVEQLAVDRLLNEAFRRLCHALKREDSADVGDVTSQTLRQALSQLRSAETRERSVRIARFQRLLDERYAEPGLSMSKVAATLQVSPWHLSRLLTRQTGQTFLWHLHSRRIAQAKQLLAGSALSVKEIAATVGYCETSQFDRRFRKALYITPTEYRAGLKRGDYLENIADHSTRHSSTPQPTFPDRR